MNQPEIDDLKKLLKDCLPPAGSVELQHDLWPAMLHRLDQPAFFPGMIPALLYHL
jgi:hypothetical protein